MKKDENYISGGIESEPEGKTLSIFCVDFVVVKPRVTCDSEVFDGIQVTFWIDDAEDMEKRINDAFDVLFEDVLKTREAGRKEIVEN